MSEHNIHHDLLGALVLRYEQDRDQFVILPKDTVDSSFVRLAIAELRNQGLVEEQVRGVIRLTARGYKKYRNAAAAFAGAGLDGMDKEMKYDGPATGQVVHVRW